MILKVKKEDFFNVLEKFPLLEKAYIKDFYEKYNKRKRETESLKIILKNNNYIPSDITIEISYLSDVFIIRYKPRFLLSYEFVRLLKEKRIK